MFSSHIAPLQSKCWTLFLGEVTKDKSLGWPKMEKQLRFSSAEGEKNKASKEKISWIISTHCGKTVGLKQRLDQKTKLRLGTIIPATLFFPFTLSKMKLI